LALITDTGPLYAAMDRSDIDHEACSRMFESTDEEVLVPSPVVVELDWLSSRRLGTDSFLSFLADIQEEQLQVIDLAQSDYIRAAELIRRYRDLPLGFVDAAVVAVAERLAETKIATLDHRHFTVVRPRHVPALRLIP
jgi:hypothetical protein